MPPVILVTGTNTEVGKTIFTTAITSALTQQGLRVVVKPTQTGLAPGKPGAIA